MVEFILDVNIPLKTSSSNYPSYLFDDLLLANGPTLVVGGTTYAKELKRKPRLLKLLGELKKSKKVRHEEDSRVDAAESLLREEIINAFDQCPNECDDHHIFALSLVSRCKNIVTEDSRIATCRDKVRKKLDNKVCPKVSLIQSEKTYRKKAWP